MYGGQTIDMADKRCWPDLHCKDPGWWSWLDAPLSFTVQQKFSYSAMSNTCLPAAPMRGKDSRKTPFIVFVIMM